MKVSGFTFVRNALLFDYPFLESLSSLLPLCDEVVVAVGRSDDQTLEKLRSLNSPKITIVETVWNEHLRTGGAILAQQTNIALDHVKGDWAIYLQADEVLHEKDYPVIRRAMETCLQDRRVEGLLFSYKHFYGSYDYVGVSREWYRNEIRIVRTGVGVRSWGDAQGFRIGERKMRVRPVEGSIYHYGWVKPPEKQQAKLKSFNRWWHSDAWVQQHVGATEEYAYETGKQLVPFAGTHPAVMQELVRSQSWIFPYDPSRTEVSFKHRVLVWIEAVTGKRLGEYRNYEIIP